MCISRMLDVIQSALMSPLIVANWKMNPETLSEAKRLFDATKKVVASIRGSTIIVAPPAIFLPTLAAAYRGASIKFAVQHARGELHGSYTGEVSMIQAKNAGATYAIIGHAERRSMGETNDDVRTQVAGALSLGVKAIVCVGEKSRDKIGTHFATIEEQVRVALKDVSKNQFKDVIIAYEPVWAIGAPQPMHPHDIHETTLYIRKVVAEQFDTKPALAMPILYGGSVDDTNALSVLREGTTQGLLVGRASTDATTFTKLLLSIR